MPGTGSLDAGNFFSADKLKTVIFAFLRLPISRGGPLYSGAGGLVGLTGLEPVTLRLSSACSNQLSYRPWVACPGGFRLARA